MRLVRGFAQVAAAPRDTAATVVRHPYFIQRNSRGSIPVYTDVRNAGGRYLVLIRNVEGNVNVSAYHRLIFATSLSLGLGKRHQVFPVSGRFPGGGQAET